LIGHQEVVAALRQGADAGGGHAAAGVEEVAAAIGREPDAGAFGADDDAAGTGGIDGEGADREGGVADAMPALAEVRRGEDSRDGAGEEGRAGRGGEAQGTPLVEAVLEAHPMVAAVEGLVDPAAGRSPDLAGVLGDGSEAEHLGVEDHAVEDAAPGGAAVDAAIGLPPGAGDDGRGTRRVDDQAGHLLHFGERGGEPPPAGAVVVAAPDAGEGAGKELSRRPRHQRQRIDGLIRQAARAGHPGLAEVVGVGDLAAPPDAPERHPEALPVVGIPAQAAHHPAGEGERRSRVLPGGAAVARQVELPGGGAGEHHVRFVRRDGHAADVGTPQRQGPPDGRGRRGAGGGSGGSGAGDSGRVGAEPRRQPAGRQQDGEERRPDQAGAAPRGGRSGVGALHQQAE
jgi:hypothetical protein